VTFTYPLITLSFCFADISDLVNICSVSLGSAFLVEVLVFNSDALCVSRLYVGPILGNIGEVLFYFVAWWLRRLRNFNCLTVFVRQLEIEHSDFDPRQSGRTLSSTEPVSRFASPAVCPRSKYPRQKPSGSQPSWPEILSIIKS